jgi:hypothetical protein
MIDEIAAALDRRGEENFNPLGRMFVVVVEMRDEVASGDRQSVVQRSSSGDHPPEVRILGIFASLFEIDEANTRVRHFSHHLCRVIGACISDDDDLDIAIGLIEARLQ